VDADPNGLVIENFVGGNVAIYVHQLIVVLGGGYVRPLCFSGFDVRHLLGLGQNLLQLHEQVLSLLGLV